MSIIHEALKKTQKNMATQEAAGQIPLEVLQKTAAPISVQSETPAWIQISCIVSLAAIVLFIIIPQAIVYYPAMKKFLSNRHVQKTLPAQPSIIKPEMAQKVQSAPAAPVAPIPAPAQTPTPAAAVVSTPTPTPEKPLASSIDMPPFKLQGIMAQGNGNVALINDHVYEEGEEINGIKITKITPKTVTISADGKEKILQLGK